MSKKSPKIASLIEGCQGHLVSAYYLGYFECFNQQLFYEAHDVLEELWLKDRPGPNGAFYKGLIQLTGAFVHLQKNRPGPGAALFRLAEKNLSGYGPVHEHLEVGPVLALIRRWLDRLGTQTALPNPILEEGAFPRIALQESAFCRLEG